MKSEFIHEKIQKVHGQFDQTRIRALFYGESGTGKTVLASTFPKPLLFLDSDDGMSSVRTDVERWPVESWEDVVEATGFLYDEEHPYKTVVVDSLNEMQYLAMRNVLESYPGVKRSYSSLPAVADYGKMIDDVDQWVRLLKALPFNIVFLAQVQRRQYETDPVAPQLTGKNTAANVCRMMDIVGYIYTSVSGDAEGKRSVAFNMPNHVCKDRSGKLPAIHEIVHRDRSFDELARYWK